jgi:UDP-N-acetylmuramoylalanine-D-glutamate ligase
MRDAVQKTTYQEKATCATYRLACASFDLFENYEDRGKPI